MNNNNNNSSFLSHHRNPKNNNHHHHHDQCKKPKVHKCEFCHKVFTTGQALGGHKTSHRPNKQIADDHRHVNKVYKTMKITFSLSCSPSNHNNDLDAKQKRHSWTRVFKATIHHPPTASTFKPSQQEELPAVDLLSFLPPRSYITKKRSSRYLVHDGFANNTAPIPSLDMSRESVAILDLNHPEDKRIKLSSNGNDSEMMQKQHVLLTTDGIDETVVKETESIHELGSRVVRDSDMALKGTVHPHIVSLSTLEPSQQELTAVDLLSFLPARSYHTKKRSRRYLIHDGFANNTAPIPSDTSPGPVANLDECKRMKLSSNVKDNVLLTSDYNDETVVSRVVQNFDLNELPTNYVETELEPKVVRDFDLNELPTNDISDEIIHHE